MPRFLPTPSVLSGGFLFALALAAPCARAQDSVLLPNSTYTKERCLGPCACVLGPLQGQLEGTYSLRLVSIGNVFDFYSVDNIQFHASTSAGVQTLLGSGTYQRSDISGQQSMHLSLFQNGSVTAITLDSGLVPLTLALPAIDISVRSQIVSCDRYTLHLASGPGAACPTDLDNGSGLGVADGAVDINDLLYFLVKFEAGDAGVDLAGGPCGCADCVCPDGAVDIQDLLFFLRHFETGC